VGHILSNPAPRPSLRRKLLIQLWGPLLIVLALGAFGGMTIARYIGGLVHDQWLLDSTRSLGAQVKLKDGRIAVDLPKSAIEMFEWDRIDRIYGEVVSQAQGRLFSNVTFVAPPREPFSGEPIYYDSTINGNAVRIVAVAQAGPAGTNDTVRIRVAETTHKREEVARQILVLWVPLQAAILLLAGAFIWLAVTRNLRKVDEIAARLADYEPDCLIPIADVESTPREIGPLINAINRLIRKLHEGQDSQKRFIANAAHQLRTPLAALQVQTERVLREPDPLKHGQALSDVHRGVTRLHHVTQQLLTLMRSERQVEPMFKLAPLDMAALAREEVERWTDAAVARDIDLGYDGPQGNLMVHGEPHLLRELASNLLDNAIRYNANSGTVTLSLADAPVRLCVEDDGPGIPESERALVLERFYRGANSENEGCGLGLPIAREIAARHGAQLIIAANPSGRGTRVEVIFQDGENIL
jgi:two-component system sensor histidine kinase TctE